MSNVVSKGWRGLAVALLVCGVSGLQTARAQVTESYENRHDPGPPALEPSGHLLHTERSGRRLLVGELGVFRQLAVDEMEVRAPAAREGLVRGQARGSSRQGGGDGSARAGACAAHTAGAAKRCLRRDSTLPWIWQMRAAESRRREATSLPDSPSR